jgi:hypothetical protein
MSKRQKPALTAAQKLGRELDRILEAKMRFLKSENILHLTESGDIRGEIVRTHPSESQPAAQARASIHKPEAQARGSAAGELCHPEDAPHPEPAKIAEESSGLPNTLPQPPSAREIGNLIPSCAAPLAPSADPNAAPQSPSTVSLTSSNALVADGMVLSPNAALSCHHSSSGGIQDDHDALADLVQRALAATKVRRGRPAALDDQAKGQLIALLSVGMSMRQAAAVLGVSHTTVQKTLKADPALAEEITAARFQAQLQPLSCVIREARRSWKAATWLLKYLDGKIATHEETPDERRERQRRETDELFARHSAPNTTTRVAR